MNNVKRLAASAATFGLLLSSTPVSAMGGNLGMSKLMEGSDNSMHRETDADATMKMQNKGMMKNDASKESMLYRMDASAELSKEERMSVRFMNVMKRTIGGFAKFTKRLCNAESSDQSTVRACMEKAKEKINVMIDTAFGA